MGLSLRAAAKELGITHPALLKAAKTGRVPRNTDGSFDVETCRVALERNSNPKKQLSARAQQKRPRPQKTSKPAVATKGDTYNAALVEHERLKIEERKLGLELRRGELVPIGPVNAWFASQIIQARNSLLKIGPELRDRLAHETDPHRCEQLVTAEVERALRQLAEYRPNA